MKLGRLFRHIYTPHKSNNHRARALHPSSILLYILLFVFVQTSTQVLSKYTPNILGYATDVNIEDLVKFTNQKRQENGLAPLTLNEELSRAAYAKALNMFNKDYWAHTGPDGTTPWKYILDEGYAYSIAGENLAKNFDNSKNVVEAWMNSPSHKDNIVKADYQDIGFAMVDGKLQGEETTLVVQMFGARKEGTVAAAAKVEPLKTTRVLPYEFAGVRNKPLVDIRSLEKRLSLVLITFLISVLFIDGYFVYIHKKVRIAGKNWAHIIFLLSLLGIIYMARAGSIL